MRSWPPGLRLVTALTLLALAGNALSACEAPEPATPARATPSTAAPTSGTSLEKLFPLVHGYTYQYVTETDDGPDVLLARATRNGPQGGSLQFPSGTKDFDYAADGVRLLSREFGPVYVLKQPLQPGNRWRGEHGGWVEIVEVNTAVEVPAGRFTGCVKTLESRGGDRPLRVATTFCPDIGIVLLEAASGARLERAALRSYGAPVDLGPDGVRRIQ